MPPRPIHDETWSTLALARNLLMGLDPAKPMTAVSTPTFRLILETLIEKVDGKKGDVFAKHVESRIETVGKAKADIHGKFADEQTYVANKISAEQA